MDCVKYLIVGGGLAGHNAAAAIREVDSQGSVLIVTAEPHRPYNRPPLTKEFMLGKDPVEKGYCAPQEFYQDKHIDLLMGVTVRRLDAPARTAELSTGKSVRFEKCLLATGGRAIRPAAPGMDLPGVTTFRTLDDALGVAARIGPQRRVGIVGGGFIGIELASALTQRGMRATVIDGGPHIWSRFTDATLGGFFQQYCADHGVLFINSERMAEIRASAGDTLEIVTSGGRTVPCDLAVVAIGIVPNVELAQAAGLAVDNGIVVDEFLQTSQLDVYAAGDNCNFYDPHSGRRRRVEHWGHADYSGTIAGQNMAGAAKKYDMLSYVWSDIFDLHLEFAGDESAAQQTLIRGTMESKQFSVLYLKDNRLVAHFSVNLKKKQYSPLAKLIEKRVDLAGKLAELQDTSFDLNTLLPAEQMAK